MWVQSLGWEGPLEEKIPLQWKIPWTEEPGQLHCEGLQRVRLNSVTMHLKVIIFFKSNIVQMYCNFLFLLILFYYDHMHYLIIINSIKQCYNHCLM